VVHVASSALRSAALVLGGIAVGVGAVVGANALTGDDGPTRLGRPALAEGAAPLLDPERLAEVEGPRTRSGSAREAVEAFLAAERAGDHTTSFAHLADSVRVEYGSAQAWAADHPDVLPPVVDFTVEGADPGDGARAAVTTLTRYRSGLDSVTGFVPARARTSWVAVREAEGWAVDVEATTQTSLLPPDADALTAARTWATDRQACAPGPPPSSLRGRTDLAQALCGSQGQLVALDVRPLAQADAPPLQTSFGADVVTWARTVQVDGPVPLRAVLAPVDDTWTVVGVLGPARGGQ
jgi:hypothetical protein